MIERSKRNYPLLLLSLLLFGICLSDGGFLRLNDVFGIIFICLLPELAPDTKNYLVRNVRSNSSAEFTSILLLIISVTSKSNDLQAVSLTISQSLFLILSSSHSLSLTRKSKTFGVFVNFLFAALLSRVLWSWDLLILIPIPFLSANALIHVFKDTFSMAEAILIAFLPFIVHGGGREEIFKDFSFVLFNFEDLDCFLVLLAAWLPILIFTLIITAIFTMMIPTLRGFRFLRPFFFQLIRKFYHFVAVILFAPPLMVIMMENGNDAYLPYMTLLMIICCGLMILLEISRHKISPLHRFNKTMQSFQCNLDGGKYIFSHVFLLFGCLLPIILTRQNAPFPSSIYNGGIGTNIYDRIPMISGIASLGILDSMAAICGSALGGPYWPGTRKTLIGSVCGGISFFVFVYAICLVGESGVLGIHGRMGNSRLVLSSILCSFWEAFDSHNDNLTLPIVSYILLSAG